MSKKQSRDRAAARSLCAEVHPDDGLAAKRNDARHRDVPNNIERKTQQLCAQVRRTLGIALSSHSEMIGATILIESVDPHPDAGRLQVRVSLDDACALPAHVVQLQLNSIVGSLRAELAAAIHRKRVPELTFLIVPRSQGGAA